MTTQELSTDVLGINLFVGGQKHHIPNGKWIALWQEGEAVILGDFEDSVKTAVLSSPNKPSTRLKIATSDKPFSVVLTVYGAYEHVVRRRLINAKLVSDGRVGSPARPPWSPRSSQFNSEPGTSASVWNVSRQWVRIEELAKIAPWLNADKLVLAFWEFSQKVEYDVNGRPTATLLDVVVAPDRALLDGHTPTLRSLNKSEFIRTIASEFHDTWLPREFVDTIIRLTLALGQKP